MTKQSQQVKVSEQIEKSIAHLKQKNYSKYTINSYLSVWKKFKDYSEAKEAMFFTEDLVTNFLADSFGITANTVLNRRQINVIRMMRILCDIFHYGVLSLRVKRRRYNYPSQFKDVFIDFIKFRREQGYSIRTEQAAQLYLERFGAYLEIAGVRHFSDISVQHLNDFVDYQFSLGATKSTACTILSILGGLFRFAAGKYHLENLADSMPRSGYRRNRPLPSTYTADEVSKLLKAVDRGKALGKRDYAILLLAAKLGIRTGDICKLQFSNLHWERNQIDLIQGKTNTPLVLPLLHEVGEAIIDYLKNGRPETESSHIFVRHQAPFISFSAKSLNLVVKKYLLKAGIHINNRKVGLHSLRHSLASSLLKENTPLPVISEILGHTKTNTTRVYLKIDAGQLKKCALEVPAL